MSEFRFYTREGPCPECDCSSDASDSSKRSKCGFVDPSVALCENVESNEKTKSGTYWKHPQEHQQEKGQPQQKQERHYLKPEHASQTYTYSHPDESFAFYACRFEGPEFKRGKEFRTFHLDRDGRTIPGLPSGMTADTAPLYHAEDLADRRQSGDTLVIAEGEKVADFAKSMQPSGYVVTSRPFGANTSGFSPYQLGLVSGWVGDVTILADNDSNGKGQRYALAVSGGVAPIVSGEVTVWQTPYADGDLVDHVERIALGRELTLREALGTLVRVPAPGPGEEEKFEADLDFLVNESPERLEEARRDREGPTVYLGLLEPTEVTPIIAISNAGKSRFALWLGGHWSAGETIADPDDLARAISPKVPLEEARRRVGAPELGFVLYLSVDAKRADLGYALGVFDEQAEFVPEGFARKDRFFSWCKGDSPGLFDRLQVIEPAGRDRICRAIDALRERVSPGAPEKATPLVVIDTLARLSPGNELDNAYLTRLVTSMEEVGQRTGAAVLVLQHVPQAQHGVEFESIDPLTYGRGGTAVACATRAALILKAIPNTASRVDGLKGIANWGGNLGPVYFETHGEGEWGKKRYRLIGPEELAEIQAQQAAATRLHPLDVLARAFDGRLESGASVTITKVRENVARLSEISPATAREPADEVVQAWHREGWAIVSDSGSGSARRVAITLTAEGVQAAKERGTL